MGENRVLVDSRIFYVDGPENPDSKTSLEDTIQVGTEQKKKKKKNSKVSI